MSIEHFFSHRQVEMSDNSQLWEVVTPDGERVASATTEEAVVEVEMALNLALTDAVEENSDIVVA